MGRNGECYPAGWKAHLGSTHIPDRIAPMVKYQPQAGSTRNVGGRAIAARNQRQILASDRHLA